jgi:hypothetical protein
MASEARQAATETEEQGFMVLVPQAAAQAAAEEAQKSTDQADSQKAEMA